MTTTPRIVLVGTLGEELFSGKSVLSSAPPPPTPSNTDLVETPEARTLNLVLDEEEPCPETLRSSVFTRVDRGSHVERTIEVTEVEIGAA
jgi:hypothetical protein